MSRDDGTSSEAGHTSEMRMSTIIDSIEENKESVTIIYFDPVMSTSADTETIKEELWVVNSYILFFTDIDSCITYIKSINKEKIFLVTSGNNAFELVPNIIDLSQLDSIFIYPENRTEFSRLLDDYSNIVDIFDNFNDLIISIKENIKHINRQMKVVSFYDQYQQGTRDLSEQSTEFLWFQLFNDIIQHLPHDDKAKKEMLTTCRQYYRDNRRVLEVINEFGQTYHIDECICWYTRETFVYKSIGRKEDSLKFYQEALQIREENLPTSGFYLSLNLNHIASLYEEMDDMTSTIDYYGKVLNIYEHHYSYQHQLCEKTRRNIERVRQRIE